ncbi:hypothetical protein NW762_000676 [Fusarium torreyae]|uniref:Uncharacterized protein n=1 Tax=Fusarium torreyae TaxID=1237075 RepID=A0A9W8SJX5_9HYPO|nr:hypothetical protein NW762_000676 [Fusarium torreyae]
MPPELFFRERKRPVYVPYVDGVHTLQPDEDESLPETTPRYTPDAESDVTPTAQTQHEDDAAFGEFQSLQYVLGGSGESTSVSLNSDNNHEESESELIAFHYAQYVYKVCLDASIEYIDKFRQDFEQRAPRAHDDALLCKLRNIYEKGLPTQSLRCNVDIVSDVFRVKGIVLEIFSSTAQDKIERDIRQLKEKTEEVVGALRDAEHGRLVSVDQLIGIFKAGRVLCLTMDPEDEFREVKRYGEDWEDFR